MKPRGKFGASFGLFVYLGKQPILLFINDIFDLAYGHIKFLCEGLKADPVKQSALQDRSVSFVENPFVNQPLPFGARNIKALGNIPHGAYYAR